MRTLRILFALGILGVLVGGPYAYIMYKKNNMRNFRVVDDGILYRSGQLSPAGLRRAVYEYGIKTVITLRYSDNPEKSPPDLAEEQYCKNELINYYRIPFRPWWASDGTVPADKGIQTFLHIMNDPSNYPVLIHCFAGIHRTGSFCAAYRMEFNHWSNADAVAEMRNLGYTDDHEDVLTYLENYQPHAIPGENELYRGAGNIRPASHNTERKAMSDR